MRGDINFIFSFFSKKKTMKGKNDFFFKKGREYRALQLQTSVVETQWIEIAD
jgi:hypothetical protein